MYAGTISPAEFFAPHNVATLTGAGRTFALERDDFSWSRHPAPAYCWSMIFSENR
jgi:hypothetical protein